MIHQQCVAEDPAVIHERRIIRAEQAFGLGLTWKEATKEFVFEGTEISIFASESMSLSDEGWAALIERVGKSVANIQGERSARQRTTNRADKEKLEAYFKTVHDATVLIPQIADPKAQELVQRYFDTVAGITNGYAKEASQL